MPILLCAVSRATRGKPHTIEKERTALPKAQQANCVSTNFIRDCRFKHHPSLAKGTSMLRLLIIILVIVVALLRGGSLRNFAALHLRRLPLVIAGFVLQLLIFTPFARSPLVAFATLPIYVVSLSLLAIWVAANWRIPGMSLIAIGLALNIAVIAANGGHMPVLPEGARLAGQYEALAADEPRTSKHMLMESEQVRFWLLS